MSLCERNKSWNSKSRRVHTDDKDGDEPQTVLIRKNSHTSKISQRYSSPESEASPIRKSRKRSSISRPRSISLASPINSDCMIFNSHI